MKVLLTLTQKKFSNISLHRKILSTNFRTCSHPKKKIYFSRLNLSRVICRGKSSLHVLLLKSHSHPKSPTLSIILNLLILLGPSLERSMKTWHLIKGCFHMHKVSKIAHYFWSRGISPITIRLINLQWRYIYKYNWLITISLWMWVRAATCIPSDGACWWAYSGHIHR